uniref:Endonuclease/exonuclease/phosphatase domain-containing protein n=1 Tax=Anguilla anguilla TaxID=7936 RepID=A0A0E9T3N4_ANGAN
MICGDFNARTGTENGCIESKGNNHVFGQTPLHLTPTQIKRTTQTK